MPLGLSLLGLRLVFKGLSQPCGVEGFRGILRVSGGLSVHPSFLSSFLPFFLPLFLPSFLSLFLTFFFFQNGFYVHFTYANRLRVFFTPACSSGSVCTFTSRQNYQSAQVGQLRKGGPNQKLVLSIQEI